mgnify:CR=1 FL=1
MVLKNKPDTTENSMVNIINKDQLGSMNEDKDLNSII